MNDKTNEVGTPHVGNKPPKDTEADLSFAELLELSQEMGSGKK